MVLAQRLQVPHYVDRLRALIHEHMQATQSVLATRLLHDLDVELPHFWQIVPKEMLDRLEVPTTLERTAANRA